MYRLQENQLQIKTASVFGWPGFLNVNRRLPLVLERMVCTLRKRRAAVLQSGSGSGLKSAAVPPALLLAAAWYLSYSLLNRSQNANK